jgi:hypothetical protein
LSVCLSVCPLVTTRDPAVLSFLVADTNYATRHQPEVVFSWVRDGVQNKAVFLGDEISMLRYIDRFVTVALGHQTPSHSGTEVLRALSSSQRNLTCYKSMSKVPCPPARPPARPNAQLSTQSGIFINFSVKVFLLDVAAPLHFCVSCVIFTVVRTPELFSVGN